MDNYEEIKNVFSIPSKGRIYFVGIGGISMSGLSEMATFMGFSCAGSDSHLSERTKRLEEKGIPVFPQTDETSIQAFAPDLVVFTSAILPGNPELSYAKKHQIPTLGRAEFLGRITESFQNVINISGTHGKTTTTAMTSLILIQSGIDPTVHLGAELLDFDGTIRMGKKEKLLVSEACEFQRNFLHFRSTTAAITNIDYDHVDCFSSLDEVIDVFAQFTQKLDSDGTLVVPAFDKNVEKALQLMPKYRKSLGLLPPKIISTGKKEDVLRAPDVYADSIEYKTGFPSFDVYADGQFFAHIQLFVPGEHNIYNALTAIACAKQYGATARGVEAALSCFKGAEGRFTVKGSFQGASIVADYAHHPAAARATLQAASSIPHKKTWVVFQPLTYKRTEVLFDDYVNSLLPCTHIIFAEIFSDREINTGTISSSQIADAINEKGGNAEFIPEKSDIKKRLSELVQKDDLILLLGPEDIRDFSEELIKE